MRVNFSTENFINSITGLSALASLSLLAARRYDVAAALLAALTVGSAGVAWDRYSTKSGSPLDIRVLRGRRRPDSDELHFIVTHLPYAFLALFSYAAARKIKG
jgi:hypothetical protein